MKHCCVFGVCPLFGSVNKKYKKSTKPKASLAPGISTMDYKQLSQQNLYRYKTFLPGSATVFHII